MPLLVLIQFDISYYGSSEAHTKVALETDRDRKHFFCSTLSLSALMGYFSCFLSCEDFQINRTRGQRAEVEQITEVTCVNVSNLLNLYGRKKKSNCIVFFSYTVAGLQGCCAGI